MTMAPTAEAMLFESASVDLFELLCERRGWNADFLAQLNRDDHEELLDITMMAQFLETVRTQGQIITISPDFDQDGIAAGVLGYAGLKELGFNVNLYVPDYKRGHDLTVGAIDEIAEQFPDTKVLLTCDAAVNSHAGIAAAAANGWITLVTDHHTELEPGSQADITVNPCRLDETYGNPGICGAHVLYQVLETYTRMFQPDKLWSIRMLRLFAGLGTVSDVMPMVRENRQLVRDAISIARMLWVAAPRPDGPYSDPRPDLIDVTTSTMWPILTSDQHHPVYLSVFRGFAALLKAFTEHGKIRDVDAFDEGLFGFYIAPAMNAPRRTGVPLDDCFAVFLADSVDEQLAAAHRVIENNELRKQLTITYTEELLDDPNLQPFAPWVYFTSAPVGMFGLLASQMMQIHNHPVMVTNPPRRWDEPLSGSGRAPSWLNIIDTLAPHEGMMAIGHQQACGIKLDRADLLPSLIDVLATATAQAKLDPSLATSADMCDLRLGDDSACDADLDDLDAILELTRRITTLKPFGHLFPEPRVMLVLAPQQLSIKKLGSEAQHIRMVTSAGMSCLWWNAAGEFFDDLQRRSKNLHHEPLRFIARLQLNMFRGETRVQAVIESML